MTEPTTGTDADWPRGWEEHERAQLLRMAQLPFARKLRWLEEMGQIVRHIQQQQREQEAKGEPPTDAGS